MTFKLSGRRLTFVWGAWIALVVPTLGFFLAAIPALYSGRGNPSEAVREGLAQLGLSTGFYAAYVTTVLVAFALVFFVVAALIAHRRPDDGMAMFASLFLVLFGGTNHPDMRALVEAYPALSVPATFFVFLGYGALVLFLFLFPDGRLIPYRMRVPVAVWVAALLVGWFLPGSSLAEPSELVAYTLVLGLSAGMAAQVYRYLRVSNAVQRQQTKWVMFGTAVAVGGQLAGILSDTPSVIAWLGLSTPFYDLASVTGVSLALLFIPLSIGAAILRYRLWDIDLVINRTLVYGALTASVIGIYILVVGYLGVLFRTGGNLAISLVATGLVAVLFQPLRERLQRSVNRLMYGERDEPYGVLSRLGRRLEGTLAPEAVLPAIVEDVARALRLGHVAIWLADGDVLRLGATHGITPPETTIQDAGALEKLRHAPDGLRPEELDPPSTYRRVLAGTGVGLALPVTHRGELVGALCIAPRGPGEGFSLADRQLLRDLATQSGPVAHAVQLTVALRSSLEDLKRSRERLVAAQEEERRRIQRDLHDGLGPVLASMRLRLEACLEAQEETPLTGDLERLYELVGQATGDIRRLVYDLRPLVLDQLGLVSALRQHCERFGRETGIAVRFEAEEGLPVPAAAEAALLRVAQEALLNVEKHARASRTNVRLEQGDGWLSLVVRDDGVGLGGNSQGGTGIGSMRERAELLGGTLRIDGSPGGGTEVAIRVPDGEVER